MTNCSLPNLSSERWSTSAPVLTPLLLRRIQELNLEYLLLLVEVSTAPACAHVDVLPVTTLMGLRKLSCTMLQNVAAAPYTLYTLGFDDQEFWLTALSHAVGASPEAVLQVADEPLAGCRLLRHEALCQAAIFFAWHLAVVNPLAARMMYGMPAAVGECLQGTSLSTLQYVMRTCPWLLMPRWPSNPRFWPGLLSCAATDNLRAMHQSHLLGHQLIASDLRVAESPTPESAGRVRAARSVQQQRWRLRARG